MHLSSYLVLEDGTVFRGKSFGYPPPKACELNSAIVLGKAAGEVVFNTGMTGYHETLTDPSYTGQIVTMTYPHIGNYGDDDVWSETGPEDRGKRSGIKAAGLVVRSVYAGMVASQRNTLAFFLKTHQTPGMTDIDTRALTLRIRDKGSPNAVIVQPSHTSGILKDSEIRLCMEYLSSFPKMEGRDLIGEVGTEKIEVVGPESAAVHFVLVDCGVKANIVRELINRKCRVSLVPARTASHDILQLNGDAVLFSNGPGDPAVLQHQIKVITELIGKIPLFGICLGHQLLSLGLGGRTFKMKFGHHGINHPVRDEITKRVFVTSQNHGFAVDAETLPGDTRLWFTNANDKTLEGIIHKKLSIMSVQFHPESAPGPCDSTWIFDEYLKAAARR
ncbi:MAG: glutamine-hydrolyzing carbamoyl-phosphate synthase small subunit [Spirochaetota bacterium]